VPTETTPDMGLSLTKLMHSWGFALREGVFAETKEGGFPSPKKKNQKSKIKNQKENPKRKRKAKKKKKKRSVKTEAQFTVSALRGSGLPSLLHLKTEDQLPISALRLRFTSPSILETDAYWLAVTAFEGSGSSPFSATFQRWTLKRKKEKK